LHCPPPLEVEEDVELDVLLEEEEDEEPLFPQDAPFAKPFAGEALSRASVAGPYCPSSAILSFGLLRFQSR
jgi:hypothetical protein